jgi:hypothetical protein
MQRGKRMDWTYNTLWTEQLPANTYRSVDLKVGQTKVEDATNYPYVVLSGFKPKSHSLTDLVGIASAQYLELIHSNIRTFNGISRLGGLKRLESHYCVKLEDGADLVELKGCLEWLHINQSKKFRFPNLHLLKNLKVLCLNSCGPLENLQFLKEMPNLLDFRFVGTNVIDGDLQPLFEHPSLVSVGFLNKRHYNYDEKEVEAHFADRGEKARIYVHKGPYRTFTYRGVGDARHN